MRIRSLASSPMNAYNAVHDLHYKVRSIEFYSTLQCVHSYRTSEIQHLNSSSRFLNQATWTKYQSESHKLRLDFQHCSQRFSKVTNSFAWPPVDCTKYNVHWMYLKQNDSPPIGEQRGIAALAILKDRSILRSIWSLKFFQSLNNILDRRELYQL